MGNDSDDFDEGTKIDGTIVLAGLPEALQSLRVECDTREMAPPSR